MPKIMENGNRDIQVQAFLIMAKVLIKMGSRRLDAKNERSAQMQEESKIADE